MAGISGQGFIGANDLYSSTATPGDNLVVGQYAFDGKSGKGFRYCLNGAVAQVVGSLYQGPAEDTTYEVMAVGTAGAAGDKFIQVTNGTATITNAQFKGGQITVYTAGTTAVGEEYTITGVTGTLTTGGALNVWIDRPLRAAITTSAKVNMRRSPWSGVIVAQTTLTDQIAGVAIYAVSASEYGWLQTHGPCALTQDGVAAATGSDMGVSGTTSGYATVYAAGTGKAKIGYVRQTSAATTGHGVAGFLQID